MSSNIIKEIKKDNVGLTIDTGHSFEAGENLAEAASMALSKDKLFHIHINDNYKLWDDDMITGSIHTIEFLEFFLWLKKLNYSGWISTDQYPYREDGVAAVNESLKWMKAFETAINKIDLNKLQEVFDANDVIASTKLMRELLFT